MIHSNYSLKSKNTFGIEAKAQKFIEINSLQELTELINQSVFQESETLILGGGSNLLFTKDFDGLVVQMLIKGVEKVKEDKEHFYVKVGAGEIWHSFVLESIKNNWCGVENLSLIPGTVGAAPMQNIGAYGVEIKEVFNSLEAVDIKTGELKVFSKEECEFGYRESIFKKSLKGKYIITSVTFKLNKTPNLNVSYGDIQRTLDEMCITELNIKAISDAVIKIRQSKLPDPVQIGNAGSFFKNPEITEAEFNILKGKFPEVVGYPTISGYVKVAAGWLIDKAGWKGKTIGDIGVHKHQALVLVNYGGGKGTDIYNLALEIQKSIKDIYNIDIIPEVNIV